MNREAKREHWQGVIDAWEESGMSKAAFCRERQIPAWKFYYWYRQLVVAEPAAATAGFAEVTEVSGSGVRLHLGCGLQLEVEPGFDAVTLKQVLAVATDLC